MTIDCLFEEGCNGLCNKDASISFLTENPPGRVLKRDKLEVLFEELRQSGLEGKSKLNEVDLEESRERGFTNEVLFSTLEDLCKETAGVATVVEKEIKEVVVQWLLDENVVIIEDLVFAGTV